MFRRNDNLGNLREINSGNHLQSTEEDKNNLGTFMEDSATAHTADKCRNALAEVFSERAVNQGLWPSRPPIYIRAYFAYVAH